MKELNTHRNCGACFYLIGNSANEDGPLARAISMNGGARKRLGHMNAAPASVATDAFRVLVRSTQVFRLFLAQNKNGSLTRTILLIIGAQKRTRTSTVLPPLGPEPSASTNSATSAGGSRLANGQAR